MSLFLSSSFVFPFLSISSIPLGFNFANTQITTRHGCAFRLRKVHEFTWGLLLQKRWIQNLLIFKGLTRRCQSGASTLKIHSILY